MSGDELSDDGVPILEDHLPVVFDDPRADYFWAVERARDRASFKRLQHIRVEQGHADVLGRLVDGGPDGRAALRAVVEYTSDPEEKAAVIEHVRDWLYPYDDLPGDFRVWLTAQARAHPTVAETLRLIERYSG
ncbi:hypothetical protein [Thalassiella azotivora]